MGTTTGWAGLSPRLRGNRFKPVSREAKSRSIPAPAGEPPTRRPARSRSPVYPRACGGTVCVAVYPADVRGLSPRHAGEPYVWTPQTTVTTVYPRACGGTRRRKPEHRHPEVYPRACGGTRKVETISALSGGLSPRLRGNHPTILESASYKRSIPAPAGEPRQPATSR